MSENSENQEDEVKGDQASVRTKNSGVEIYRKWRLTGLGKAIEDGERQIRADGVRFKVMSYNILAPIYVEQQKHLYADVDESVLAWENRWRGIKSEITLHSPDIVTLQEAQFFRNLFNTDIKPWFEQEGYDHVSKQRTNDREDGCAVFVNSEKFQISFSECVEYNKDAPNLDKDNVGLILGLKTVKGGKQLLVATTHLLFSPRRKEVRLAQTALMLAHLDKLAWNAQSQQYLPVILTGDFNDVYNSLAVTLVTDGSVQCPRNLKIPGLSDTCQYLETAFSRGHQVHQNTGALWHHLGLRSSHQHRQSHNDASTFHDTWMKVDYIFYSTKILPSGETREGRLKLLGRFSLPNRQQMALVGKIPNHQCPSDHLPLVAEFLLL